MKVVLVDLEFSLCEAWRAAFAGQDDVHVHNDYFETVVDGFDCFVSAANAFGIMDGGIDAAIIAYFGTALQDRVQQEIWSRYRGEQPVGTCLMVPTEHPRCPWLAHCPTMRVPMDVSKTNFAYAAFLAALTAAEAHGIQVLGCPGLGTLTGRMPAEIAARQMRYAFDRWRGQFAPSSWEALLGHELRSHGRL